MNLNKSCNPFVYLLTPVLATCLTLGISFWPQNAEAHKGHAGPTVTFMKNKVALKAMLPVGAKIVKRKQPLKDGAREWAEKTYGVKLDEQNYSYYLATDKKSGKVLGAAYITRMDYRHGDLKIAVGIDEHKHLTQAVILGIKEKYVVDYDGNVGTGLINGYAGISFEELIAKVDELASSDKATREFAAAVRDAAVLLATFIR